MSVTGIDLNFEVLRKVKGLSPEAMQQLESSFDNAPLAKKFINYLSGFKKDKLNSADAVLHLYGVKQTAADYKTCENKFYKLRKKILDFVEAKPQESAEEVFTAYELKLNDIKGLLISGKFTEAKSLLINLEKKLWDDNVFEMLPEVLDHLVHTNQVLRTFDDNKEVYNRLDTAVLLFTDITEAKKLARIIYEVNINQGIKAAAPLFGKLLRLTLKHKGYPRFKLIYNLVSATCKVGGGGLDYVHDFKVTNRFITVIKKLHAQYPSMPDFKLVAGYSENQSYSFRSLEVMNNFNAHQFKEAAVLMKPLFDWVIQENSGMKRMRGAVFFRNYCLCQLAGGNYEEAMAGAQHFLQHLLEIKQHDIAIQAYGEIINVCVWMYPQKSNYTVDFMEAKLEEFIAHMKKFKDMPYYYNQALWLKVRYCMVTGKYAQAIKLFKQINPAQYFMDAYLPGEAQVTMELLAADVNPDSRKQKIQAQINKVKNLKLKAKFPPDYVNYAFLEKHLNDALKKAK
jgi:hypothetical protein